MAPEGCGWHQIHPQGNVGASGLQILNLPDSAFLFIALAFAFPPGEGERSSLRCQSLARGAPVWQWLAQI